MSIQQPDGRIINPRRLQTGGIPPYQETRNYVANGLIIARQVQAASIFGAAEFVASRFPDAQPNGTTNPRIEESRIDSNAAVLPAPSSMYASESGTAPVSSNSPAPSNSSSVQQSNSNNASQTPIMVQPRSSYAVARGGR